MEEIKVNGTSTSKYEAKGRGLVALTPTGGYLTMREKLGWGNTAVMILGETRSLSNATLFNPTFKLFCVKVKNLPSLIFLEAEEKTTRTVTFLKEGE